jgi:hypothetical protein
VGTCLDPSVALTCKGPLNAHLATGVGLSFFLSRALTGCALTCSRGCGRRARPLSSKAYLSLFLFQSAARIVPAP